MAKPDLLPVADEFYQELDQHTHAEEALDYPLAKYVEAAASGAEEIEDLARDNADGPGYSQLLDLNRVRAKALPWLGQFIGLRPPERLRILERTNLNANPRAVSGVTTGYQTTNATLSIQDGVGYGSDTKVFRAVAVANGAFSFRRANANFVPVVAGGQYTAIGHLARVPAGRTVTLTISWFTAGSVFISASTDAASAVLGKRVVTAVAPPTAAFAVAGWDVSANALLGEYIETDAHLLASGVVADYFDGDTPDDAVADVGYRWTGARLLSSSEWYRKESDEEYATRVKPLILARLGWERGTPKAMKAAIQQYMTGTKQVIFRERTPTPYSLQVRTLVSETPNSALVLKELTRPDGTKPAGIKLDFATVSGQDWLQVETDNPTWASAESSNTTWANLRSDF